MPTTGPTVTAGRATWRSRTRVGMPLVLVLALMTASAACGDEESDRRPAATNPPITGAVCRDPTGDLSRVARELGGNLAEPAGIDIVAAEAQLTDTALRVRFETAGPISDAPNPEFRLGQGPSGQIESFELVATPGEGEGVPGWELRLVTFRSDAGGGVREAPRVVLPVPVTVEGATLSFEVPRAALPPIVTYVWLFGASSTADPVAGDTVIDDCEQYGGSTGTTTSGPP